MARLRNRSLQHQPYRVTDRLPAPGMTQITGTAPTSSGSTSPQSTGVPTGVSPSSSAPGSTPAPSSGSSSAVVRASSGVPTTATAINPMAQGFLVYSDLPDIAYVCLYHGGADEGARLPFGGGQLPPLTPQDPQGGAYTLRAYDALTGGNLFWESANITVAANPHLVGGSMTLTPAWVRAWKTSASNGGNLTSNDNYIDSTAPMSDASIYASLSNTIPPDQPGGGGSEILGSRTHIVDQNNRRVYVNSLYVTGTGTVYIWVIAVNALDGTTTRALLTSISPITVS